jgi:prepilin-type N-terminal cleavage/methylation domain-containing protein
MQNKSPTKPSAFSLIELSIVLIIIGLLAGGIVVGTKSS